MLSGDIELPTKEEMEYLDRYFPKGDKRRGDALVIYAYMKNKLVNAQKKYKEVKR
jgi:hypothetical protein